MQIRPYAEADWPQVWPIIREIVQAQETFTYDPGMTEPEARAIWLERPPGLTVVAADGPRILGTAKMGPNRAGPGAHVSTASFMVAPAAQGDGVGTALCRHAVAWAKEHGYTAMQFNAVAASNHAAVHLYERLGFTILATVPAAFAHPAQGLIGLHLMYLPFD